MCSSDLSLVLKIKRLNVSKIICNLILCPAIQTRACNRHFIEAWTAFVMWSSNVCYLFFPIKIPFISHLCEYCLIHIFQIKTNSKLSRNPDCFNISKGITRNRKARRHWWSIILLSFIYTTDIDCTQGRMLMIVHSFSMISLDKLVHRTLIYSSIKHDVQYHEWRMNFFFTRVDWYSMSICLSNCIHIRLSIHTHVDVLTSDRIELHACSTVLNEAERFDDN